jgi:hypothetical protein
MAETALIAGAVEGQRELGAWGATTVTGEEGIEALVGSLAQAVNRSTTPPILSVENFGILVP